MLDKELIKAIKKFKSKYFRRVKDWEFVIDMIQRIGVAMDGVPSDEMTENLVNKMSKAEYDDFSRFCNFMNEMIEKYGKEALVKELEAA